MKLSERINQVKPSATIAVSARAAELRREGKPVINLSVGEPDFDTPDFIREAGIKAIQQGFTKYTAVDGTPELKQAIVNKLKRDNALTYQEEQIIVSSGAKQSVFNLCQALLDAGDEVIIPAPYWVSYPDIVTLSGGTPVICRGTRASRYKVSAEQIEALIRPQTRAVLLNSPSNPTGKCYNKDELRRITGMLLKYPDILLVTDDIYEYIVWEKGGFVHPLNVCPELSKRTVLINGVSKAYAMTGWRIGYAAGPIEIIKAMKKIQSQSTSNPNSIAQKAAVAALNADPAQLNYMVVAFRRRHDYLLQRLRSLPGFDADPADGTFYLFPNVEAAISRAGMSDDVEFAKYLLEKTYVATVPGSAFGMKGHLRLSYAVSDEQLEEVVRRLHDFIDSV